MHNRTIRSLAAAAAAFLIACGITAPLPASAATTYTLAKTVTLGGEGFWDYLTFDAANQHVFISRGTHVMVTDPAGTIVGDIPDTAGVHGIAIADDLGKGFTSNGRDGSVTVFDLKTFKTLASIPVTGKNPDCIIYDAASKRVFTFNGGSDNATAIDATLNKVLGTVTLPGRPEFAVSGENGIIYNNIEDKNELVAINATSLAILNTWSLGDCDGPSGLSMDIKHLRLFPVCGNKIMPVVDALSGKIVATVPIGQGPDASGFDPGTQLAFSSNGRDGTLTVVHEDAPDTYSVVQTATTQPYARTMALDPATHTVYLVTAKITTGPPAPGQTRPSRKMEPGSFTLLVMKP